MGHSSGGAGSTPAGPHAGPAAASRSASLEEMVYTLDQNLPEELRAQLAEHLDLLQDNSKRYRADAVLVGLGSRVEWLVKELFASAGYDLRRLPWQVMELLTRARSETVASGQALLPQAMLDRLAAVHRMRNRAAHEGFHADPETVRALFVEFMRVLAWYFAERARPPVDPAWHAEQYSHRTASREAERRLERQLEPTPIRGARPDSVDVFRDRQEILTRLKAHVEKPGVRLIGILGRQSTGKTALLSRLGKCIEDGELLPAGEEPAGILYASCALHRQHMLRRLCREFSVLLERRGQEADARDLREMGSSEEAGPEEKADAILGALWQGWYVVALDGMEDVLGPGGAILDVGLAAFVHQSVRSAAPIKLIVTSTRRMQLKLARPEAVAYESLLRGLPPGEACALLRQLDVSGDFTAMPDSLLTQVAEVADGNPRVLKLLVGKLESPVDRHSFIQDPGEFTRRFVAALRLDAGAALYGSLTYEQQRVVEALSLFGGAPVSVEAIEAVLRDNLDPDAVRAALSSLYRAFVVEDVRRPTGQALALEYRLDPSIVEFAYQKAAEREAPSIASLHGRAAQFMDGVRRAYEESREEKSSFLRWFVYEDSEWQKIVEQWLYHLARSSEKEQARRILARLYLDAWWWYGNYQEFGFCRELLFEWNRTQTDPADRKWAALLWAFQEAYPVGPDKIGRGDWSGVAGALLGLLELMGGALPAGSAEPIATARQLTALPPGDDLPAAENEDGKHVIGFAWWFLGEALQHGARELGPAREAYKRAATWFQDGAGEFQDPAVGPWVRIYSASLEADLGSTETAIREALDVREEVLADPGAFLGAAVTGAGADGDCPDLEALAETYRIEAQSLTREQKLAEALQAAGKRVYWAYLLQGFPPPPDSYTRRYIVDALSAAASALHGLLSSGGVEYATQWWEQMAHLYAPYWRQVYTRGWSPRAMPGCGGNLESTAARLHRLLPAPPSEADLEVTNSDYMRRLSVFLSSQTAGIHEML